ncbi:hypothetical protein KY290_018921 [Solanum tuberosum]|uniref:Uncharacterized protein n=1 Tax=Solanum tuberosum TaxID=4113 RepID=A0ABQ7VHP4_SOLTU|nr:hypothetical protein KY290_018921 [Solanum tuberosum]
MLLKHWILSQTPKKSISPKPVKNNVNNIKGRTGHHRKRIPQIRLSESMARSWLAAK